MSLLWLLLAAAPLSGIARGDGYSFKIVSTRVRLFGIDAPELNQCRGRGFLVLRPRRARID